MLSRSHLAAGISATRFDGLNFSRHSMLTLESVDDPRHSRRGQPERRRDIFPRHSQREKVNDHAVARLDVNVPCVERSDPVSVETPFRNQKPFIPGQSTSNQPFSPSRFVSQRPRRSYSLKALFSLSRTCICTFSESFMRLRSL